MKLAKPFYRLPVRFDVERLRSEVAALPADAWSRHPNDFAGNTAARLITVDGGQNDSVGGAMAMTPALRSSPYLQQLLASFGTVISRCRLMRIAPGETVPQHSDINYHWFYRVRIHVPIYTRPEVRFFCEEESVHMAAGEAWIFDNWRQHRVENPSDEARIHLVADTTGTSFFWGLVAGAQSADFERPNPRRQLLVFDPARRVELMIERFNVARVMPPSEVEQLAFDLLGDLAPAADGPESEQAVSRFVELIVDFCRDWRSIWHLHGETPAGLPQYATLLDFVREQCHGLPVAVASVGVRAEQVLNVRILEHAVAGLRSGGAEAPEFNRPDGNSASVAAAPTAVDAPAKAAAGFTAALLAETTVPRRSAVRIERPLIIVSAPRAGSTLLFETLAQVPSLYSIGGESHLLLEGIDALRPGAGSVESNRLTAVDATPEIAARLREGFAAEMRDRTGQSPASGSRARLLEKTPKNALRVPFLLEVFPDALFVFLHRDPRANISSIMEAWHSGGWVTYRNLAEWEGDWSLLLPPGYGAYRGRPLSEIAAFQWTSANEHLLADLQDLPQSRWLSVRYEDVVADPATEVRRILEFSGLAGDTILDQYLARGLPESRYTQTSPAADKWRRNATEIERVLPLVEQVARRLGRWPLI